MPLPLPNLDDRRWVDLVQEGQSLIPFYAPEWTDHNFTDPGITLVDLFAWLTEMDIYQLNRIPEQHRRKFLALIGIRPQPPQPAQTVISFRLQPIAALPPFPHLPAEVEFEGADPFGQPIRFRTLNAANVVAGRLQAVQVKSRKNYQDFTSRWQRGETVLLFSVDPRPGAALYLGFDTPLPPGLPVSLFFTFAGTQAENSERQRLIREMEIRKLNCHPPDSLVICNQELSEVEACSNKIPAHHAVRNVWEFLGEHGRWQRLEPATGQEDEPAGGQVHDDTRSFTLNGHIRLNLPEPMGKDRLGQVEQTLYYLRCRLLSGTYEAAPEMRSLAMNAVPAEQAVTPVKLTWNQSNQPGFRAELLGQGTGNPLQQVETSEKMVVESGFRLYTQENGDLHAWECRQDFDASAPDDRHFMLDATLGWVTFGDGEKGRTVPYGASIVVQYLTTRAEKGNLPTGSTLKLIDNVHNRSLWPDFAWIQQQIKGVTNSVPTCGGVAAEDLVHAEGRAFEHLSEVQRAVTLEDIEKLARQTPGVRLARASALANRHPAFPGFLAPGVITLIVLPYLPLDRPAPSASLRREVMAYLSRRRVIGTRLEVIGPTYVEVSIRASVQALERTGPADLQKRIETALNRFFHPLTGGPDGQGWPFGRDVYRSEVLQVIDETPGVDHVLSIEMTANDNGPQCGNICLGPAGLVAAGQHRIDIVGR